MSEGRQLTPAQQFNQQLDAQVNNFRALLPSHISVEKFKRTVVVAVAQNPELMKADRRSFFNAAQKCAGDGLLPDGREAALVIFRTKTKVPTGDGTYEERWIDAAQYLPMIQGIRKRMRNSGEVLSAEAHVVYRNDKFVQSFGDDGKIVHEPPALGQDRGEPVGAYAIIKLKSGETIREVMDRHQIERVRAISRSKDGPAWKQWWDEMARKVVLRRCSKAAPTSAELDELLSRDEEPPDLPSLVELPASEPEPPRASLAAPVEQDDPATPAYIVVDADGEEHEYATAEATIAALLVIFRDARRRGGSALQAAIENNEAALRQIKAEGPADLVEALDDYINPLGLPPSSPEQRPAHPEPDPPGPAADHSSTATGQGDLLPPRDGPDPDFVPPPPRGATEAQWQYWLRQVEYLGREAGGNQQRLATLRLRNEGAMQRAKQEAYPVYQAAMAALRGEPAEAAE